MASGGEISLENFVAGDGATMRAIAGDPDVLFKLTAQSALSVPLHPPYNTATFFCANVPEDFHQGVENLFAYIETLPNAPQVHVQLCEAVASAVSISEMCSDQIVRGKIDKALEGKSHEGMSRDELMDIARSAYFNDVAPGDEWKGEEHGMIVESRHHDAYFNLEILYASLLVDRYPEIVKGYEAGAAEREATKLVAEMKSVGVLGSDADLWSAAARNHRVCLLLSDGVPKDFLPSQSRDVKPPPPGVDQS